MEPIPGGALPVVLVLGLFPAPALPAAPYFSFSHKKNGNKNKHVVWFFFCLTSIERLRRRGEKVCCAHQGLLKERGNHREKG